MSDELPEPLDEKVVSGFVDLVKNTPNELIYVFLISNIILFVTSYFWERSFAAGQLWFLIMIIPTMFCVGNVWQKSIERNWSDLIWNLLGLIGAISLLGILSYFGLY